MHNIWKRSSLPTAGNVKTTAIKIRRIWDNGCKLKKVSQNRRESVGNKNEELEYKRNLSSIFDICSCQCDDLTDCACVPNDAVPLKEHRFLLDQRGERKMLIGGLDQTSTDAG